MEIKVHNVASNAETSAVLQMLKRFFDSDGIPCETKTKDIPGTKGEEILIALALNISGAMIWDLLKMAFRRCFGGGSSEEIKEVKISLEIGDEKVELYGEEAEFDSEAGEWNFKSKL